VAEQFGKAGKFKTPVVESTGTGGGMKLFCGGVGPDHPDLTNASRRMKKSELEECQKNGVKDIVEMSIGYDGLTIAHAKSAPDVKLTKGQVFLALAKQVPGADGKLIANPYKMWSEIDPSLPAKKIEFLGPPPTSGTRDSFNELILLEGAKEIAKANAAFGEFAKADAKAFDKAAMTIREDGVYIDSGENDNVIVQKLGSNADAFGAFGFSFLEENLGTIKGVPLNGTEPTFENIAAGKYKAARSMFVYVKKQHVGVIPGIVEFVTEYMSDKAMGEGGYLEKKGLVILPEADLKKARDVAVGLKVMTGEGL
jgi:phosphate transport system substrate-binding protein